MPAHPERRKNRRCNATDRQGVKEGRRQPTRFIMSFLFDRHAKRYIPMKEAI
jgi:hypothetical protein